MPFPWIALAISAAFTFLGQLLTPKNKKKAETLDQFDVPTATEDRPKPLFVGTVRHKSPNCIWYGDYSAKAIKNKVSAIGAIASFGAALLTRQIIGYKYMLGIQLSLGWGTLDEITAITLNDKVAWTGSASSGTITIDKPELFGTAEEASGNGGFQAAVVIYNGNGSNIPDPYIVSKSGATPAYRNDILLVMKGLAGGGAYVGNSPNFPEISVDVRRCPNQLGVTGGKHIIDTKDANPICCLYELMTREKNHFGGGYSPVQFNTANWIAAAETLHTEGLGVSRMFDQVGDVENIINDYLQMVDAVININMTTGKFEIALARFDYDPETILEIGDDDIVEVTSYKRGSWIETYNEVKLSYIDRTQNFETIPIAAQDIANASGQAEVRATTTKIEGLSNPVTANKALWRELKVVSTPLATIGLKINRIGFALYPGAVFKWVGTRYGVVGMIFRVTEIDGGTINANTIDIKAVQDIFALGSTAYLPPAESTWEPPVLDPTNITVERIMEQPYFFHGTDNTRIFTVAKPANGSQLGYDLNTFQGADPYSAKAFSQPFTATGVLAFNYVSTAYNVSSELIVTPQWGMEDLPATVTPEEIALGSKGILLINNEIFAYESWALVGSNFAFNGVWGGILDTVLGSHIAADRVWFLSDGIALDPTNYVPASLVTAKLTSIAFTGTVPLGTATAITI